MENTNKKKTFPSTWKCPRCNCEKPISDNDFGIEQVRNKAVNWCTLCIAKYTKPLRLYGEMEHLTDKEIQNAEKQN